MLNFPATDTSGRLTSRGDRKTYIARDRHGIVTERIGKAEADSRGKTSRITLTVDRDGSFSSSKRRMRDDAR